MPECNWCQQWIQMCYTAPCHGTVWDISNLIDAGNIWKLSLQVGIAVSSLGCVSGLVPSPVGWEGKIYITWAPLWKCSLLNDDDSCSVHNIKPIIWKSACCKSSDTMYEGIQVRESWKWDINWPKIIKTWWEYHGCSQLVEKILKLPMIMQWEIISRWDTDLVDEPFNLLKAMIIQYNNGLDAKRK